MFNNKRMESIIERVTSSTSIIGAMISGSLVILMFALSNLSNSFISGGLVIGGAAVLVFALYHLFN